jgi:23S rRNA (uracil1939-C5)-methyltransferase
MEWWNIGIKENVESFDLSDQTPFPPHPIPIQCSIFQHSIFHEKNPPRTRPSAPKNRLRRPGPRPRRRFVVFVDDALPGETVRARIYKKKKKFAFGRAIEVLEASPDRVVPTAPWPATAAGAPSATAAYAAQLRFKKEVLVESLYGIDGAQELVRDVVPADPTNDYRNKMVFSFGATLEGELRLGLHRRGSFIHILPAEVCKLQSAASREIVRRVVALAKDLEIPAFHEIKKTPGLRTLTIREARNTGQRMVELSPPPPTTTSPNASSDLDDLADTLCLSLCTNTHGAPRPEKRAILKGPGFIEETLNGLRFRIGPDTFFQSNTAQAETLFARVRELATASTAAPPPPSTSSPAPAPSPSTSPPSPTASSASKASRPPSRPPAKTWPSTASRTSTCSPPTSTRPCPPASRNTVDLVVVDPPRPGLSPEAIAWITASRPATILYVSCNPSTLARDLKLFLQSPYASRPSSPSTSSPTPTTSKPSPSCGAFPEDGSRLPELPEVVHRSVALPDAVRRPARMRP